MSDEEEVQEFQYWTIYPESKALQNARLFLLGRIILLMNDNKPVRSAEKCPDTFVSLIVYKYNQDLSLHAPQGKTSLLKSTTVLHINVTSCTKEFDNGNVHLNVTSITNLEYYIPLTDDINISQRLTLFTGTNIQPQNIEDNEKYIVEEVLEKNVNSRLGQYEFLVKWKDYSSRYNTWE